MIRRTSGTETRCVRCGNCCRWPGFVWIQADEVDAMARFLGLDVNAFTERYTRLLPSRMGLALAEAADDACVFLEDNACRIHAVKPRQCRDFPDGWAREEIACPCQMRVDQEIET